MVPKAGEYLLGMSAREFPAFRGEFLGSALKIAGLAGPTGAVLGTMIGVIAGLLLALAGRRPRLVGWLVAWLLLACVMGSIHVVAFDRLTVFVTSLRLNGLNQLEYSWYLAGELASAMGATAGAVVGAVISCGAVRMDVRSRRQHSSGTCLADRILSQVRIGLSPTFLSLPLAPGVYRSGTSSGFSR